MSPGSQLVACVVHLKLSMFYPCGSPLWSSSNGKCSYAVLEELHIKFLILDKVECSIFMDKGC